MLSQPPFVGPLPLLPPLLFSLSVLVAQNLRPISEAVVTRQLRTRTTITRLSMSISPFRLHVKGLRLVDANTEPLLTADKLNVRIDRRKMLYCNIVATGLVLHADINPVDWQDSNWGAHLSQIAQKTGSGSHTTEQSTADEGKGESDVQVPVGALAMSIAAHKAVIRIKQPPITLPLPPLVIPSTDLSSISAIRDLVSALLGKAARDAGSNSLPRELRIGARRAARGVTAITVEKLFTTAGKRIGQWGKSVDQVQNYLGDVPDLDDLQKTVKNVRGLLQKLENMLSKDEQTEDKDSRLRGQRGAHNHGTWMRDLDEGDMKD